MRKSELKQIIREVIEESNVMEGSNRIEDQDGDEWGKQEVIDMWLDYIDSYRLHTLKEHRISYTDRKVLKNNVNGIKNKLSQVPSYKHLLKNYPELFDTAMELYTNY